MMREPIDIPRFAEFLEAAAMRLERADRCRDEGRADDEQICLIIAKAYLDKARGRLGLLWSEAMERLMRGEDVPRRRAAEAEKRLASLGGSIEYWRDFEEGYWDARGKKPIRDGSRGYVLGYRAGQDACRTSG